ncbi:uncharacterized protein LOC121969109 [Zingiber officinale]|uniref:uncharacterized protein LOC121969109 n=1 Tax=Zingiber officinale TaxID=94328 RepID=UPI001C4BF987|nr:uncharacterized protein LOC121969109 [Zingiber officinale]
MITEMMNQDVYFAKLARVVGRFEDMREYMEKIAREAASEQNELTTEEHELLSGTYENVIGSRLAVLKNISSMIKEEVDLDNRNHGIARAESGPGNPIRLNLALNFSMFYIEALCSPEMACTIYYQEERGRTRRHTVAFALPDSSLPLFPSTAPAATAVVDPRSEIAESDGLQVLKLRLTPRRRPRGAAVATFPRGDTGVVSGASSGHIATHPHWSREVSFIYTPPRGKRQAASHYIGLSNKSDYAFQMLLLHSFPTGPKIFCCHRRHHSTSRVPPLRRENNRERSGIAAAICVVAVSPVSELEQLINECPGRPLSSGGVPCEATVMQWSLALSVQARLLELNCYGADPRTEGSDQRHRQMLMLSCRAATRQELDIRDLMIWRIAQD